MIVSDKWVRTFPVSWRGEDESGIFPVCCLITQWRRLRSHTQLEARAHGAGPPSPFVLSSPCPTHLVTTPATQAASPFRCQQHGATDLASPFQGPHKERAESGLCSPGLVVLGCRVVRRVSPPRWAGMSGSLSAQRGWSPTACPSPPPAGPGPALSSGVW